MLKPTQTKYLLIWLLNWGRMFYLSKEFPSSTIVGADIDKNNIELCIKNNKSNNIFFIHSNYENIKSKSPFDMIFCMSVL